MWDDALLLTVRERIADRLYAHARRRGRHARRGPPRAEGSDASDASSASLDGSAVCGGGAAHREARRKLGRQFRGQFEHTWNPRTTEVRQSPLPAGVLRALAAEVPAAEVDAESKTATAAAIAHETLVRFFYLPLHFTRIMLTI